MRRTDKLFRGSGRLSVCLGYLLLCSLLLTGITFSRYVAEDQASDAARVAAGVVEVYYDENTTALTMNRQDDDVETRTFSFTVSNAGGKVSEVAIAYDIVVTLNETLPDGVTISLDDSWLASSSSSDTSYTFQNAGTFEAGQSQSQMHTLTVVGDYNSIGASFDTGITITVRARQID